MWTQCGYLMKLPEKKMTVSKAVLKLDDIRFPPYLRLFENEILDFLLSRKDLEYIKMFKGVAENCPPEYIDYVCAMITDAVARFKEDIKGTDREIVIKPFRRANKEEAEAEKLRLEQDRDTKYKQWAENCREKALLTFMWDILHDDKSIHLLDQLLEKETPSLWKKVHLFHTSPDSPAMRVFFERFYRTRPQNAKEDEEFEEDDIFLDRVAACFEPEYIMAQLVKNRPQYRPLEKLKPVVAEGKEMDHRHWARIFLRTLPLCDFVDEDWFFAFADACRNDPYNVAMLMSVLPDYDEELAERAAKLKLQKSMARSKQLQLDTTVTEEITEMRKQDDYRRNKKYFTDLTDEPDIIRLRPYQEELVEHALAGQNAIVCAPTGAGKTEVCIFVALQHMLKREGQGLPSRVLMLVPKIPLVDQQKLRFHQYLRGQKRVDGFHGEETIKGEDRLDLVLASDVVIVTPQILVNMLTSVRSKDRLYVCDFSLVIFDEVHHCSKKHAYKKVMDLIHDYKYPELKPQIMGLTASLLTTTMPNLESSLNSIHEIMANIGATALSTVRTHIESLEQHVPKPDEALEKVNKPASDAYGIHIKAIIHDIRSVIDPQLKKLAKSKDSGANITVHETQLCSPDATEKFEQLVILLRYKLKGVSMGSDKYEPMVACQYLIELARALAINDVMPAIFAHEYLADRMNMLVKNCISDSSARFYKFFQGREKDMQKAAQKEVDKPIVKKLKDVLVEQFERDPNSRCIIFVNQRSTAYNLSKFLNSQRILGGKRDFGFVTSVSAGQKKFGQSMEEQRATLDAFNKGKLKCVVSTSVLDEGVDVRACNLIIKYNCSSSAVSKIQKSGRARARGSKSWFICLNSNVANTEYDAIIAGNMMRQCIRKIQNDGPRVLARMVEEKMKDQKTQREHAKKIESQKKENLMGKQYDVMCKMGNHVICSSDMIRTVADSNYVVVDRDVWQQLHVVISPKTEKSKYVDSMTMILGDVRCKGEADLQAIEEAESTNNRLGVDELSGQEGYCGCQMGRVIKYSGAYLPTLKVNELAFRRRFADGTNDQVAELTGGWNKIREEHFYIQEATEHDLSNMLNALVEVYAGKKSQLDLCCERMFRDAERARDLEIQRKAQMERVAQEEKADWPDADDVNEEEGKKEDDEVWEEKTPNQ